MRYLFFATLLALSVGSLPSQAQTPNQPVPSAKASFDVGGRVHSEGLKWVVPS